MGHNGTGGTGTGRCHGRAPKHPRLRKQRLPVQRVGMGPRSLVNRRWQSVWSQRSDVSLDGDDTLESLIRADGFNTGFGDVTVDAWTDFVDRTCAMLGLGSGDSLFEVGC